jgi:hypothetical protein
MAAGADIREVFLNPIVDGVAFLRTPRHPEQLDRSSVSFVGFALSRALFGEHSARRCKSSSGSLSRADR